MALLTIDIAFDWDSKPKDGYDGFVLCGASGFDLAVAGNPPPNARGLTKADQLQFAIYDVSDQTGSRQIDDLDLSFQAAHDANTSEYPFEDSVMGPAKKGWYPLKDPVVTQRAGSGNSGVYGGPFPVWSVSPSSLSIPNPGWYFFRVSFEVTQGSIRRSYGNDPEMIVRQG